MPQKFKNHHHINWRHLTLGVILNILVVIVALIIYHQTFNTSKNECAPTTPMANPNLENGVPSE